MLSTGERLDCRRAECGGGGTEPNESLVLRARGGERGAFSILVGRYERAGLAVAVSILRCRHDARDAVQDAFVTAYERLNRLWSARRFGGWFLRIVRRQALWQLRRRRTRERHLSAVARAEVGRREGRTPEESDVMIGLIGRLPDQEALVVSLRHLDERSVAEISAMTGRPVGTVTKQLSRAYARMRGWLRKEDLT